MSPGLFIFFSTLTVWEKRVGEYERPSFGTLAQKFSSSLPNTEQKIGNYNSYYTQQCVFLLQGIWHPYNLDFEEKISTRDTNLPEIEEDGADVRDKLLGLEVKLTEVLDFKCPHLWSHQVLKEVIQQGDDPLSQEGGHKDLLDL